MTVQPYAKIVLVDFFERYCARGFLRRVNVVQPQVMAKPTGHTRIASQATGSRKQAPPVPAGPAPRSLRPQQLAEIVKPVKSIPTIKIQNQPKPLRRIVGKQLREDAGAALRAAMALAPYPISNNIGVGILSYQRLTSLERLVESIRRHTDLRRTTIFISDDGSTDPLLLNYLDGLGAGTDFVVLRGPRLGVAGNSNRLLRCLSRFRHGLLLNDDVEVMAQGWEEFHAQAAIRTRLHHFCMRQPGVYGAKCGELVQRGDVGLTVVNDRPHGAVLYFDNHLLNTIGYFDEEIFGLYGMEHVDWSERAQQINIIPGYYDVIGSERYFVIHQDSSAVADRQALLVAGRQAYANRKPGRCYVAPGPGSSVPSVSCVIPCRNSERSICIETVIAGIRAQRFPQIEIVVAEHDSVGRLRDVADPYKHVLVTSGCSGPFNKAKVFNAGVAVASAGAVVLHDADMLMPATYVADVYEVLRDYDACHLGRLVVYVAEEATATMLATGILGPDADCDRLVGYFEGGSLGCRRHAYWLAGGFNEDFIGYGVEDCEFYARLSAAVPAWREGRCSTFVHLWHGRAPGWEQDHNRNKVIGRHLEEMPMDRRVADQLTQLRRVGYVDQVNWASGVLARHEYPPNP